MPGSGIMRGAGASMDLPAGLTVNTAGEAAWAGRPRAAALRWLLAYHLKTRAIARNQVMKVSINPVNTGTT
ncbi:hypothetical protein F2P44_22105 [Massilia sp. CCM 8695]|uniref:Uncharacterized protein n=1 Tax=Massilia frigida TaxID=2609281 RepID=A0ABX0N956_9BURK|nr:hypothetical protein [Massilia frigida]